MSFDLDLTAGICAPAFQDVGDLLEPGGRQHIEVAVTIEIDRHRRVWHVSREYHLLVPGIRIERIAIEGKERRGTVFPGRCRIYDVACALVRCDDIIAPVAVDVRDEDTQP